MDKLLVVLAGGGAAGKTTTTRAFAIGNPQEFQEERIVPTQKGKRPMKVNWTFYDNMALIGNHKSGTDSNTGPGATREAFLECVNSDHDVVFLDGFTSSPQWATMVQEWNDANPDTPLYVYMVHFKLTAEDLLQRLSTRRGVPVSEFIERMEKRVKGWVRRPELLVMHFQERCPDWLWAVDEIDATYTTDDIVHLIDNNVCDFFGEYDE